MSKKNGIAKLLILFVIFIAILFPSCSPSNSISETATVKITAINTGHVSTIIPTIPKITSYHLELKQGEEIKYEQDSETGSFTLTDILIGTYKIEITAYQNEKEILFGESSIVVKPTSNSESSPIKVTMNFITEGEGILEVNIFWNEVTENNQIYTAIHEYKQLGFRAVYGDGENAGKPLNGIMDSDLDGYIRWANSQELSNGSLLYSVDNLEPTDGDIIIFQIYTKIGNSIQLIAETFPSVMQIYPNLTSKPDENEVQNFKLDSSHIISYIENISNPKASINTNNPSTSIDLTWTNPKTFENEFEYFVRVTAIDANVATSSITADSITYNSPNSEGSLTLKGLQENHTYNIYFQVIAEEGFSDNSLLLKGVQPKVVVESIGFNEELLSSDYVMGDRIVIDAIFTPANASDQSYTISINRDGSNEKTITVTESTQESERTFEFAKSGDYTIQLTSIDNPAKKAEKSFTVSLATPKNLNIAGTPDENGISLNWDSIDSADKYKLVRIIDGNQETEIECPKNSYTDKNISSGHSYSYKVMAMRNDDEKFNSDFSETTLAVNITTADITITLPSVGMSLGNIFEDLSNRSIVIGENNSISISISNDYADGATYKWILNEDFANPILSGSFEEANYVEIHEELPGLKKNSSDGISNNSLMLIVTVNGKPYSSTGYFNVINNNAAGTLQGIKTEAGDRIESTDNVIVYYGSPLKLNAVFQNEDAEQPDLEWTSTKPEVISVSQDGVATTLRKGEPVEITVKVTETGESMSVTLNPYVKASAISFTAPDTNYLILEDTEGAVNDQVGVRAYNSGVSFNLGTIISTPDNMEASGTVVYTYDEDIISIDSNGVVKPKAAGTTTIKASIDDEIGNPKTTEISLTVYDLNIEYEGKPITGTEQTMDGGISATEYTLNLTSNADLSKFSIKWCFNNSPSNTGMGAWGSTRNNIEPQNTSTEALLKRCYGADDVNVTALIYLNEIKIALVGFRAIQ